MCYLQGLQIIMASVDTQIKASTHRQVKIGDERFLQKCKAVYDHSYSPLKTNNKIYLFTQYTKHTNHNIVNEQ